MQAEQLKCYLLCQTCQEFCFSLNICVWNGSHLQLSLHLAMLNSLFGQNKILPQWLIKPAMRKPTVLSDNYNAQFHRNPTVGTVTFFHSDWPNRWWTHIVHTYVVCCQGRIVHFCDPDENSGSVFWGGKEKSVLLVNSILVYLIFSCVNWSHCHTVSMQVHCNNVAVA